MTTAATDRCPTCGSEPAIGRNCAFWLDRNGDLRWTTPDTVLPADLGWRRMYLRPEPNPGGAE